jgi:hypothetical protein
MPKYIERTGSKSIEINTLGGKSKEFIFDNRTETDKILYDLKVMIRNA